MTYAKRMVLSGIAVFVVGCAVGFGVGTYGGLQSLRQYMELQARVNLQATAARAQTELRQLELLRSGQVDEVIDQLELFVDSRTLSLGVYESAFRAGDERAYARRVLGEIDAHRDQYEATLDHPVLRERLDAALALAGVEMIDRQ